MCATEGPYVIAHGDVWNGSPADGRHVCDGTGEMAVSYDAEDGVLHKHGEASRVQAWAQKTRKKLAVEGADEFAQALTVISFPVSPETVAELNACIAVTGRVMRLPERLEAIAAARPDLVSRPHYPSR